MRGNCRDMNCPDEPKFRYSNDISSGLGPVQVHARDFWALLLLDYQSLARCLAIFSLIGTQCA